MPQDLSAKKQFPGKRIWAAHLKAWRQSGLSRMEYCRRQNLSYHAFNYWKRKFNQPASTGISFVPVPARRIDQEKVVSLPVSVLRIEVGRFKIEVPDSFSPRTLVRVISTLEECR